MPLTHDIGVRIPYPLLENDCFGGRFLFLCPARRPLVACFCPPCARRLPAPHPSPVRVGLSLRRGTPQDPSPVLPVARSGDCMEPVNRFVMKKRVSVIAFPAVR